MSRRLPLLLAAVVAVCGAAWVGRSRPEPPAPAAWEAVFEADGLTVRRSPSTPAAYLLTAGGRAVLIDAPVPPDSIRPAPAKLDAVLLTHHHRDTVAAAGAYALAGVPVRAAPEAAAWLGPDAVTKYWAEAVPLRDSRTAYFVVPAGTAGITYDLADDTRIPLGGWEITAVATPGHSRDHTAFAVVKTGGGAPLVFCGDAVTGAGKLWTPFTTDWDHWTDAGLKPAGGSLRRLAGLKPAAIFPARGPVVREGSTAFLESAAAAVDEIAFLKSFERYTNRLSRPPAYDFLVPKDQVGSNGSKPWARLSDHLWITGNTYVLTSKEGNACLVLDPWAKRSVEQIGKLRAEEKLGAVEVVVFSHAHYDHFDGVYDLPGRDGYKVWALDVVAGPLKEPFRFRAPFLDPRPIRFDKELADGDTATWREYAFRFHHLPGQTEFTSGIEATIDGKRCFFTADNFFHQAQYSGSGGWMGLNRSFPPKYAASAKRVLTAAPEWVLAEHGGPFVFDREDFRRRVGWGEAAGRAADAVCPGDSHLLDWNPHRVSIEPVLVRAKPGDTVCFTLRIAPGQPALTVKLDGQGVVPDQTVPVPPGKEAVTIAVPVPKGLSGGRHVFAVRPADAAGNEVADPAAVIDVFP